MPNKPVENGFDHTALTGNDCSECHISQNSNWKNVHFNHSNELTNCGSCHEQNRPKEFITTQNNIRKFSHDYKSIKEFDCVSCHKVKKEINWSDARMIHNPKPESCRECHENERPGSIIQTKNQNFDHRIEKASTEDCNSCHDRPGKTWSQGLFDHNPKPNTCLNCHDVDRPKITNLMNHKTIQGHFEIRDCKLCHSIPTETESKFEFKHTDAQGINVHFCLPCHLEQGQKQHPWWHLTVSFKNQGNCFKCHKEKKSFDLHPFNSD